MEYFCVYYLIFVLKRMNKKKNMVKIASNSYEICSYELQLHSVAAKQPPFCFSDNFYFAK